MISTIRMRQLLFQSIMHGDNKMNIGRRGVIDSRMTQLKEIQKRQSGSVSARRY